MKRWLIALLAVFALAVPATASANPSPLERYGIGVGHSGDIVGMDSIDRYLVEGGIEQGIRATVDACWGDPASSAGPKFGDLAYTGDGNTNWAAVLPVADWQTGDCWNGPRKTISNQADRDKWYTHCKRIMESVNYAYSVNGKGGNSWGNVLEVWNEPNRPVNGYSTLNSWWTNVYVPCFNGARAGDSDVNVVPGGLAYGNNGTNDAVNWINAIVADPNKNLLVNAFAVHPYGATVDGISAVPVGDGLVSWAGQEFSRACKAANAGNKEVMITETGYGGDNNPNDEGAQVQWYDNFGSWVHPAALYLYVGHDKNWTGVDSSGLLRPDNGGKPALFQWDGEAGPYSPTDGGNLSGGCEVVG